MLNWEFSLERTRGNEALCLTVAAGLHVLALIWNPILLKSDYKKISEFVEVESVVEAAGGQVAPEKPVKMSMFATLKDMLLTPKTEELSHIAPTPIAKQVAAPAQPALKEATRRPIAMPTFQPQSQSE